MGSLSVDKAGVGSAVNDTTGELGGTLGVAVIGSVFTSVYVHTLDGGPVFLRAPDRRESRLPRLGRRCRSGRRLTRCKRAVVLR